MEGLIVAADAVLTKGAKTQWPALKQKIQVTMRVSGCLLWSVKSRRLGQICVGVNKHSYLSNTC